VGRADALQVKVGERDCAYAHQFSYKNDTRHPTRPSAWPNSVADTLCWREPPRTWCAQQPTDATNGGAASALDRLSVWPRCHAVERIACSPVLLCCSAPSFAAAWGHIWHARFAVAQCAHPRQSGHCGGCRFIAKWRRPAFVWGANSLLFEPGHRFVHFGYWAHYFMSDRHADDRFFRFCVCARVRVFVRLVCVSVFRLLVRLRDEVCVRPGTTTRMAWRRSSSLRSSARSLPFDSEPSRRARRATAALR
jgi:hypothetical protein